MKWDWKPPQKSAHVSFKVMAFDHLFFHTGYNTTTPGKKWLGDSKWRLQANMNG
jgi:hypothetical protein